MVLVREVEDELEDRGEWCLAVSRIMPSLEDLHQAILLRDLRKVRLLCAYSPINTDSSLRSVTALSLAVRQGNTEIVAVLLEHGANIDKLSRDVNGRLETPLVTSCRQANYQLANVLLKYGADVNAADFHMRTPLWIAVRERAVELVQLLIDNGANLNAGDRRNQCPLYLATKYLGRTEIAKKLIRHGCKLDPTDLDGRGAVYWAIANNQTDVFKMLIYAGAHVNRKDRDYMTNNRSMPVGLRQNENLIEWIKNELHNPPSLFRSTAQTIRHRLGEQGKSIWPLIDRLPLPEKMKEQLKNVNYV